MNEIAAAASMSAVRDTAGCACREEGQQPPIVVVGGVRQRAVLDFEDAEDAVKESGGGVVEQDGHEIEKPGCLADEYRALVNYDRR